jgi:hypothetical protein
MRFARIVFIGAGIWGIAVLMPVRGGIREDRGVGPGRRISMRWAYRT